MYRRQFLGTVGVFTAAGLVHRPLIANTTAVGDWKSEVIQTVGQAPNFRPPVVADVALNPAESLLAIVGDDHFISVYDLASKTFAHTLRGHSDWVRVAKFSPDGKVLLTAGNDRKCLLWKTTEWDAPYQMPLHTAAIIDADICPQSRTIAIVGFEQSLHLYDLGNRELQHKLTCSTNDVQCVRFSHDGSRVAAAGRDGNVRVWDVATRSKIVDLAIHRQRILDINFLPDGRILSASQDQFVKISDPDTGRVVVEFPRFAAKLYCVATLDEAHIVTGGSDNEVSIWNIATREKSATLKGHTGTVSCLVKGASILVSGSFDTQVRVWRRELNTSSLDVGNPDNNGWNSRFK
ncbi:MAG: WD40 repeat domain-containing protein [Pirellulaceae bacterium]|jgi:WD40 repeat protein|nr:WD40 repeat domain-containing protein [Pirellulaceae bacterium]